MSKEEWSQEKEDRLADLENFLEYAKTAVPWMVDTLVHATDQVHPGLYSPELEHAILLKKEQNSYRRPKWNCTKRIARRNLSSW